MEKDEFPHVPAFKGLVKTSLGLLLKEYGKVYVPGINLYGAARGTMQIPPYPPEKWDGYLEALQKGDSPSRAFAILAHVEDGHRYIGHTSIERMKWPDAVGTTGSIMFSEETQGGGHGTEAKLLLLNYCFMLLGLRNVRSTVKAWNARSLGHLVKCGYRIVGRYEEIVFHEGKWIDEIILQVSRKDFEPIWRRYQETKTLPKLTDEQRTLVAKETGS